MLPSLSIHLLPSPGLPIPSPPHPYFPVPPPFPIQELFKLSRHLETVCFKKGETVLTQGRDNLAIFLLLEGEVELVVDVPLTADR